MIFSNESQTNMCVKIMAFIKMATDPHVLESFNDTQAEGNVGGRKKRNIIVTRPLLVVGQRRRQNSENERTNLCII